MGELNSLNLNELTCLEHKFKNVLARVRVNIQNNV